MDRVANLSGWSWTFILEGIFTILFGIVSIFLVPRTIEDVRFLNKQEKRRHARVLYQDDYGHHQTHQFSFKEVLRAFMGIHVWFGGVMSFTMGAKLAGVA
ncbi:hypothetical protein E1B28_010695 [Marasmius oreades]|uniref:Uncharacterized protein n=1 Tax=Marasmius oreades TaxID=181124 RepID=A0A9P7RYA8_9AGAR|nr:uncharacterized protein E1B28_010695 [Marasmius oreades]KAG7091675.1 hypothetical protein E1B28_010695 [Marasmius oreades]